MEIQGILTLITEVESGKSNATGNDWYARDIVVESTETNGRKHTIAARVTGKENCDKFNKLMEGDKVSLDLLFRSTARTWRNKETGKDMVFRSTGVVVLDVRVLEEKGF